MQIKKIYLNLFYNRFGGVEIQRQKGKIMKKELNSTSGMGGDD